MGDCAADMLPGGVRVDDGTMRRDFRFRPLTGHLELMLADVHAEAATHPVRVTRVLAAALHSVGGANTGIDEVRGLSVGDRQFLMGRLAAELDASPVWLTPFCHACGELYDTSYRPSELPFKPAGAGYPSCELDTPDGRLCIRVPTGADQEAIADIPDEHVAMLRLLDRLVRPVDDDAPIDVSGLQGETLAAIESTIETMAPEVANELVVHCPRCEAEQRVRIHPYSVLERPVNGLLAQVHNIAAYYHWSEQEILALPRHRRKIYLDFIDHSRGVRGAEAMAAGV